ncbi:SPFH domain-containing protein [Luteipulveratus flavus]|uniref:SPFH domain-containing protein n=1 Tax=Luteipulveratus flavus TaxID=3031728 RepID=A0ABT6CAR3_9MICO|nr:SPFH domain-containing protein [Luteipulveratus sp. YIM 133296]MDF8265618.1 SPFH domain-containing protein [Luteipulveratus sp. YIM 133296]
MSQMVQEQMHEAGVGRPRGMSSIKEALGSWGDIRQLLRGGQSGAIVPVVIPKDSRGLRWLALVWLALWAFASAAVGATTDAGWVVVPAAVGGVLALLLAALWWWRSSIVEIEEGTVGVLTKFGAIAGPGLSPGRHYLWHPWARVAYVVDVTTEIPYNAPVLACPTHENVPLKSIEFFLKFRILNAVQFVQTIGAGNFDLVLSNSVQDAIRQRSRLVRTERAYDLRGSDVADMQDLLNRQLARYGVQILGCNIPDVQLPTQYQQHISTRERVAKELSAYEKEWELTRKRRIDTLLMDIERSKKVRDAKIVEVNASLNKARKDVAQMLEEQETEAQRVKYEIETRGRTNLVAAQGEARAQEQLATAYRDNRAVLGYELARRRLDVGAQLAKSAPQPVIVQTDGGATDSSALSTLMLAQLLPQLGQSNGHRAQRAITNGVDDQLESLADRAVRALDQR